MPFTAQELTNIANAALDFYIKGPAMAQSIQERPTLAAFKAKQKKFPGGKGDIRRNVKGVYSSGFTGYSHDDTVGYVNPANIKQVNFPWREIHAGISFTHTELKRDGISVVDSMNSEDVTMHSDREMTAITNLLDDKLDDLAEGSARSHNEMLFRDGTQDAKAFPGILSLVTATPAVGVKGGLDSATTPWWRNRALAGASKITASATLQTLTKTLRSEVRQLTRYGGRPSLLPAGSAFIDALELEVAEKGIYTQEGFTNKGKTDIGMATISMRGVGEFYYDPTLDDLGLSKVCLFLDTRHIFLDVMDGEDMKTHAPARPADKYVMYRGLTWTGGLVVDQLNCHGYYEVA